MSEDNVSEAADDSGHEGSGDRHMTGSREAGLEGSMTQGTSMKDSGCGSGGQESLKALHDQVGVSVNSVSMMLVHVSKYHTLLPSSSMCVCICVCACVHECVRAYCMCVCACVCVCVCVWQWKGSVL